MLRIIVFLIVIFLVREFSEFHEAIAQPTNVELEIPSGRPIPDAFRPPEVLPTPIPPDRLSDVLNFHPRPPYDIVFADEVFPYICSVRICLLHWVPQFQQLVGGWCWNATAQIIMHYRGVHKSQCEIAGQVYSQNCCTDGNPHGNCGVIQGGHPQYAFMRNNFTFIPLLNNPLPILDWDTRRGEIQNDRPYISYVRRFNGNVLHTVVVEGYIDDFINVRAVAHGEISIGFSRQVYIHDPINMDPELIDYDYFSNPGTPGQCRLSNPDGVNIHVHCGDVYAIDRLPGS